MDPCSEGRYRTLFENMDEGFCAIEMIYDGAGKPVDYRFLEINKTFVRQTGLHQALEKTMREMVPDHDAHWFEIYGNVARTGESIRFQNPATAMGRFYDVFAFRIGGDGSREVGILFNDVTESKRMQEALRLSHDDLERRVRERTADLAKANEELRREAKEKAELQAQLIQSQKMEAIGRLAGGVSHDFNNLLTAISGYTHLLLKTPDLKEGARADLEEILKAGSRAESLTRQLLAFSRQQVLKPKIVDINVVISDMEKMLQRLIGEDINLVALPRRGLATVKADPGQIEQIILNLVVNARDAMPDGGKITVETENIELSEEYTRTHPEVKPGLHVMLAVSDTGAGMDARTQARIFEPFFTTKEQGKGTGLGLSTVYGIVKQSGGSIFVYSEPGRGSCFKVYLPAVSEPAQAVMPRPAPVGVLGGSETVMLVEDDAMVRKFLHRLLRERGYVILEARSPEEALAQCATHQGPIHLLVTDIVMPGMRGDDLANALSAKRPGLRIIFMSGYTEAGVVRHDILGADAVFIQKPIAPEALLRAVREMLDRPSAA